MGKISLFTQEGCDACKKTIDFISSKTSEISEISVTQFPEWKSQLFLATGGMLSVPQVFFNKKHIGGLMQLEELEKQGKLDSMIKECIESEESPLELRTPQVTEFLEVVPKVLRDKWQHELETELGPKLRATTKRPITGLLILIDTPGTDMVVLCSAGETATPFPPGSSGPKGKEGNQDKFYCQVAIERNETLFMDGPSTFLDGLMENFDHVQFGWSWYLGAPWQVRDIKGTIAILEKEAGILKPEHRPVAEAFRDKLMKEFKEYLADQDRTVGCSDSGCDTAGNVKPVVFMPTGVERLPK